MDTREYALELLASGISPVQVAAAVGVEESRISQLMADEGFVQELAEKKSALTRKDLEFDETLQSAEKQALDNIEKRLPLANMQQSLHAFKVLNGARRRKDGNVVAGAGGIAVVVNISLPQSAIPQFVTNQKAEIVEVDGKTLVSASPRQMKSIADQRRELHVIENPEKNKKAEELIDMMPVRKIGRQTKSVEMIDLL